MFLNYLEKVSNIHLLFVCCIVIYFLVVGYTSQPRLHQLLVFGSKAPLAEPQAFIKHWFLFMVPCSSGFVYIHNNTSDAFLVNMVIVEYMCLLYPGLLYFMVCWHFGAFSLFIV